jgi:hypothetical protein
MVMGATASALVAALFERLSALAMTGIMSFAAVASAAIYAGLVRPAERRAALAPGAARARGRRSAAA